MIFYERIAGATSEDHSPFSTVCVLFLTELHEISSDLQSVTHVWNIRANCDTSRYHITTLIITTIEPQQAICKPEGKASL